MASGGFPDLPGVRHEYVDAGGLRTHVALAGPEDAPPIVLAHGWPQNWWAWRYVIPALSGVHRVIVPDLRGHGWSEVAPVGYEKEQLASDMFAMLDALGVEQATWVGHDWGAWIGFLMAFRAPERFERMLALGIPHPWIPPHPRRLALLSYQGPISLPLMGRLLAKPMVRTVLNVGRGSERLDAADLAVFAERIPASVTVAMYRTFLTHEVVPVARGRYANELLQMPTKLFVGADDLVSRGIRPGAVEGQPNLEVRVLEGVAHWIPEQRAREIIDWVDEAGSHRGQPGMQTERR